MLYFSVRLAIQFIVQYFRQCSLPVIGPANYRDSLWLDDALPFIKSLDHGWIIDYLFFTEFVQVTKENRWSMAKAYDAYLNGEDVDGEVVGMTRYMERGAALGRLQEEWISVWDYRWKWWKS